MKRNEECVGSPNQYLCNYNLSINILAGSSDFLYCNDWCPLRKILWFSALTKQIVNSSNKKISKIDQMFYFSRDTGSQFSTKIAMKTSIVRAERILIIGRCMH